MIYYFYPSACSTSSIRADSSFQTDATCMVTLVRGRENATRKPSYQVRYTTRLGDAMPNVPDTKSKTYVHKPATPQIAGEQTYSLVPTAVQSNMKYNSNSVLLSYLRILILVGLWDDSSYVLTSDTTSEQDFGGYIYLHLVFK